MRRAICCAAVLVLLLHAVLCQARHYGAGTALYTQDFTGAGVSDTALYTQDPTGASSSTCTRHACQHAIGPFDDEAGTEKGLYPGVKAANQALGQTESMGGVSEQELSSSLMVGGPAVRQVVTATASPRQLIEPDDVTLEEQYNAADDIADGQEPYAVNLSNAYEVPNLNEDRRSFDLSDR